MSRNKGIYCVTCLYRLSSSWMWRGGRAVEGARLESVYTLIAYRGFESLSLRHVFVFLTLNLMTNSSANPSKPNLLTPQDVLAIPFKKEAIKVSYGQEPSQFGEIYLPKTKGPHPVIIVLHGGCWMTMASRFYGTLLY